MAADLSSITLKGFEQERLTSRHIRLNNKTTGQILHLQWLNDPVHNQWDEKKLEYDLRILLERRKKIYSLLGLSNITFTHTSWKEQTLTIAGHYKRLSGKIIFFQEKNFYKNNQFLQMKLLAETAPAAQINEAWLKEIKPFSLLTDVADEE